MNKLFLIVGLVLVVGLIVGYVVLKKPSVNTPIQNSPNTVMEKTTSTPVENTLVPQQSSTPELSLEAAMKKQLAAKYQKSESDTNITISTQLPMHAKGMVDFAGEQGGGQWYAYKAPLGNGWQLVFDGQATMSCEIAMSDAFPVSMVSECLDPSTGNVEQR